MTEILQPYSVSRFNKIPDLHHGTTSFHAKDGMKFVSEVFGPLVLKHGLEDQLGITILHRHFDLKEPEKLVEFNNIALPWKNQGQDDSHSGGKILPNAWLLDNGKLMPYEFFFSPFNQDKSVDLTQDKVRTFLDEFVKAAKYSSLDQIFALKMFPGIGFTGGLEFSEDRANIVLKPGQVSHRSMFEKPLFLGPLPPLKLTYRCSTSSKNQQLPRSPGISSEGGWSRRIIATALNTSRIISIPYHNAILEKRQASQLV